MDDADHVLERLERIRALDRRRAPASVLLDELRELVGEAERWSEEEGDARARAAVFELATTLGGGEKRPGVKLDGEEVTPVEVALRPS